MPCLKKSACKQFVVWLICCLTVSGAAAAELGHTTILAAAADTECYRYRPLGVCLWLQCDLGGCRLKSSLHISHFLPDAVVTVYSQSSPWGYEKRIYGLDGIWSDLGGGHPESGAGNLRFYDAGVIGSPALGFAALGRQLLCPSPVRPLQPYFLSKADFVGWRQGFPDSLQLPQLFVANRTFGNLHDHWGRLYPRQGFIIHSDSRRAAAVIAWRAVDIVSHKGQLRVYRSFETDCGKGCEGPSALSHDDEQAGDLLWQQLFPVVSDCNPMRTDSSSLPRTGQQVKEQFAWQLWRRYSCCMPRIPKGQKLLGIVPFKGDQRP